uniref:Uncharacterized protein n=1 Tax=Steinernema glaseri TaxID=37863 RepID=A0A1I8AE29_9BILA
MFRRQMTMGSMRTEGAQLLGVGRNGPGTAIGPEAIHSGVSVMKSARALIRKTATRKFREVRSLWDDLRSRVPRRLPRSNRENHLCGPAAIEVTSAANVLTFRTNGDIHAPLEVRQRKRTPAEFVTRDTERPGTNLRLFDPGTTCDRCVYDREIYFRSYKDTEPMESVVRVAQKKDAKIGWSRMEFDGPGRMLRDRRIGLKILTIPPLTFGRVQGSGKQFLAVTCGRGGTPSMKVSCLLTKTSYVRPSAQIDQDTTEVCRCFERSFFALNEQ